MALTSGLSSWALNRIATFRSSQMPPGDFDHALLMRRVERDQRLVEQQQARPADAAPGSTARAGARRPTIRRSSAGRNRARPLRRAPSRSRAASPCRAVTKPKRPPIAALATTSQPVSLRPAIAPRILRHVADLRRCRASPAGRARAIAPEATGTRPSAARMSVVLPAPFAPSMPTNSPSSISKLAAERMSRRPSLIVTSSKRSALTAPAGAPYRARSVAPSSNPDRSSWAARSRRRRRPGCCCPWLNRTSLPTAGSLAWAL